MDSQSAESPLTKPNRQRRPKNLPPKHHPLEVIERAKQAGIREVIVSFSAGKDSLAAIDLCSKHFDRIEAYFMYLVPDMSFQEMTLADTERRYGIKILRVPDKRLCDQMRGANLREFSKTSASLPAITYRQVAHYARYTFGINWIASGEVACESLSRIAMIKSCKGVDRPRGYIYPIGFWRPQDVYSYLQQQQIPLPPEYTILGTGASFGGIRMEHLLPISEQLPEDYAKIKKLFPHVDAELVRYRIQMEKESQDARAKS